MLKRVPNVVLVLISALLLSAGWFQSFTILILFSWIPLLIIEDRVSSNSTIKRKTVNLTGLVYLCFFIWNLVVCWWIYYASFEGACMAIICNPIFMCMAFMIWHQLKQRVNKPWAVWLLIPIWLGYEYGHTLWDLTWSWLILGNVFAFSPNLVQWYEFTGTSGGSLWILITSIVIFNLMKANYFTIKKFIKPILVIVVPISISYIILSVRKSQLNSSPSITYKTLVVQPNVDPYNEKFYNEPEVQLKKLVIQLQGKLDSTIDFLVLPETFLTENIFEGKENNAYSISFLRDSILSKFPHLTIITGGETVYAFKPNETPSATARQFNNSNDYYDFYNTGIQIDKNSITLYHKSKLVPGVERMPFPALFKPLEKLAINLGGTMGSLGTQKERTVFYSHNKQVAIAPVICYESVYPDYVAEYIRNGANFIFILTNDGWWSDSPGYKHHLAYAKLRAIETRKEIARCANTGVSCFITPLGEIEQATPFWEEALITKNMTPNSTKTFFVRFGDVISYCASLIAILLFIWSQLLRFKILKK